MHEVQAYFPSVSYPERIVADETEPGVVALHLKRYAFAVPHCADKDVLDAACGTGYGSSFLAQSAKAVTAIDVSEETIEYARRRYDAPNITFATMDAHALELPDGSLDTVCAFEMIEHVERPAVVLSEFARVLRPGGTLVVSTPRAAESTTSPENPFHVQEWEAADFEALLRSRFRTVELYGQWRKQTTAHRLAQRLDVLGLRRRIPALRGAARALGTAPTAELTLSDIVIERDSLSRASEIVAVCRDALPG